VREIRTLRAIWRALETELRQLLNGHEEGNLGYKQGETYAPRRQCWTLPRGWRGRGASSAAKPSYAAPQSGNRCLMV
jgi:hypothetical protein